jgi:hypothetical protein
MAVVVGPFNNGSAVDLANYRPISLLQSACKLYGRILVARLQIGLGGALRRTQYGFRRGRSTPEPMLIATRVQELVRGKRGQVLHLLFLDWQKAFDSVDTRCLPVVLEGFGGSRPRCREFVSVWSAYR